MIPAHPNPVILGLVPRTHGADQGKISTCVRAFGAQLSSVHAAGQWVLGTSPRMTEFWTR